MKRLWIALAALLACGSANAQSDYPNKPVRLIVDSAAGSANDATARILATALRDRGFDLVMFGMESTDAKMGVIPAASRALTEQCNVGVPIVAM